MPEIYSMSRWNEEDKYGEKPMRGDRYVRSIRHKNGKKPKKVYKRGCENNNYGPHLYAGNKSITVYVDRERPFRDQVNITSYCLFCNKRGKSYYGWKSTPNPPSSLEVIRTDVRFVGEYVRDEHGWRLTYDKIVSYDGETDKNGARVERY